MAKKTVGGWPSRPTQTPESRLARILRTVGDDEETCQNLIDQIKARFNAEKLLQVCPSDWWVEHEATHHIIAIAVEKGKELKNEEEAGYIPNQVCTSLIVGGNDSQYEVNISQKACNCISEALMDVSDKIKKSAFIKKEVINED